MTRIPRSLWTKPVHEIDAHSTAFEAAQRMFRDNVSALVVLEDGAFVGLVLERDLLNKAIVFERHPKQTLVKELMTKEPLTVTLQHSVDDALRLMTDHQVHHLPLLDGELPLAMLSFRDLFEYRLRVAEAEKRSIEALVTADAPGG